VLVHVWEPVQRDNRQRSNAARLRLGASNLRSPVQPKDRPRTGAKPTVTCRYFEKPTDPPCSKPVAARGCCHAHYSKLKRAGAFGTKAITTTGSTTLQAKALLHQHAEEYARLHMKGARVAARRGDTRPADWALLHTRTVDPVSKEGESGSPRVVVQVGFALPGLGVGAQQLAASNADAADSVLGPSARPSLPPAERSTDSD